MPEDKKISAKELFKDYVPEILEYDPKVDAVFPNTKHTDMKRTDKKIETISFPTYENNKIPAQEFFKDYTPEILEYDEKIDGSDEHQIRENMLNTKESLLDKIRNAKAKAKSNKTTYRQNIRTENEKNS